MNIKAFFVDALSSALELRIGTPEDVLRHVTPDVLSVSLPRPLWARLLTACLGAPRIDAQLVIDTIGIANLCEHVPSAIIWACVADMGARALGKTPDVPAPPAPLKGTASGRSGMLTPPPDINNAPTAPAIPISPSSPVSIRSSIPSPMPTAAATQPLQDVITELEEGEEPRAPLRPRALPSQRFRQSSTGVAARGSSVGSNTVRRPQAVATPPPTTLPRPSSGRRSTELEPEPQTSVDTADWGSKEIAVDDSQLVDWQTDVGSASPITGDDDFSDLGGRKR
jgi:hypothetical protein